MRKIVYERPDGGLSVVHPAMNTNDPAGWNEADSESRAWNALPDDAINPRFVNDSEIPTDRTFRNAWVYEKGAFGVDMPKAREIHRGILRGLRKPILDALDIDFMKALESGDINAQQAIATKKQALRDVTKEQAIESAKTPEALKTVIPDILKQI